MLSKSAIELWYRCNRAWKYAYVDGVEPLGTSPEQAFGIAGHLALELKLKDHTDGIPKGDLTDLQYKQLQVLMEHDPGPYPRMTAVELGFGLSEAPAIKGYFDAVESSVNHVDVWEMKFTRTDFSSDWNAAYWEKLAKSDIQVGLYQIAARRLYGTANVTVIYNVFRIPQLKRRRTEELDEYGARLAEDIIATPERYYQRARVRWSEAALAALETDINDTAASIASSKCYPRSRRCFEFGKRCGYYSACLEGKPITDASLYRIRVRR